jgi:hypothetical protein
MEYRNPEQAFDDAIRAERLNISEGSARYAGDYMYMYTDHGRDYFKHIDTRKYVHWYYEKQTVDSPLAAARWKHSSRKDWTKQRGDNELDRAILDAVSILVRQGTPSTL